MNFAMLNEKFLFSLVGYICAGVTFLIFANIHTYAEFLNCSNLIISILTVSLSLLGIVIGIVFNAYFVPKYGKKAIYEHDILIAMIGMLFIALAINYAMYFVGMIVCFAALAIFFYENFNRQVQKIRDHKANFILLSGWALGPILTLVVILIFTPFFSILVNRLLMAHFILLSFYLWIHRLDNHDDFIDAPTKFLFKKVNQDEKQDD